MKRAGILLPELSTGDAVSNDAIGMGDALRAVGYEVELFAGGTRGEARARPAAEIGAFLRGSEDLLIYHYCIAWEEARLLIAGLKCRRLMKYHNVTPPEFFEPYHAGIANACRVGRSALRDYVNLGWDLYVGASRYNNRDLLEAGAPSERCFAQAPMHAIADVPPRESDTDDFDWLMVGRVVPNKGFENLLRAFAYFRDVYGYQSRLWLIGKVDPALRAYNQKLERLIRELRLEDDACFVGRVSDAELRDYYARAGVFALLSEHEGFCVPLVEAMAYRVPIIAYGSSAVAETAGDGALVWDRPEPALFAASAARIRSDSALARGLGERGRRRFEACFTQAHIRSDFLSIVQRVERAA